VRYDGLIQGCATKEKILLIKHFGRRDSLETGVIFGYSLPAFEGESEIKSRNDP